jgi:hypothetical protein
MASSAPVTTGMPERHRACYGVGPGPPRTRFEPLKFSLPLRGALTALARRISRRHAANLALGKPATQSSVSARWSALQAPEEDARGANDGVIDGSQGFCTDLEPFPWWQVDLQRICGLHEVRLYNRKDWAGRLRNFSIQASLDGERWLELSRKADGRVFGHQDLTPYVASLPKGTVGRFVRIQLLGTGYLHFNECEIFGAAVAPEHIRALTADFDQRLEDDRAEQEQWRETLPQSMSAVDIDVELSRTQRRFPFPLGELKRTEERAWILRHAPKGGVGAEVGVFRGHFSEVILGALTPKKLYLIDPWEKQGKFFGWGGGYTNDMSLPTAVARRDAELRARKFPDTEVVIVEDFFPACRDRILEPLDWIYIDSSHDFDQTLLELTQSAEIVKPGGLIMGDDFVPLATQAHQGVARAVNTFVSSQPFEFVAAGLHEQWCIRRVQG